MFTFYHLFFIFKLHCKRWHCERDNFQASNIVTHQYWTELSSMDGLFVSMSYLDSLGNSYEYWTELSSMDGLFVSMSCSESLVLDLIQWLLSKCHLHGIQDVIDKNFQFSDNFWDNIVDTSDGYSRDICNYLRWACNIELIYAVLLITYSFENKSRKFSQLLIVLTFNDTYNFINNIWNIEVSSPKSGISSFVGI